ncbi:MAG: asparagine synthase [Actinomycetia bacterium]|nr:asparagine synthase [Actinomycetes bacterium]
MNVLLAACEARRDELERGIGWAQANGATSIDRIAGHGGIVALASDGGSVASVTKSAEVTVASLGLSEAAPHVVMAGGPMPGGTVGAAVSPTGVVAAAGPGNQRLFVHSSERGSLVSTHVGAIVAGLGAEAKLDRSYEDFLLGFGFLPEGRTLFDGLSALDRPDAIDVVTGTAKSVPADETPPEAVDPEADLAELLLEIVDAQAGAARTVGVLLGGFDSALVAAALHRTGRDVHTFTFSFSEPGYEQRNVDEAVAAAQSEHHWVEFTPELLGDALVNLPTRLNQPSPQPHYQIQTIIAAEAARTAGAEIIFTGDGCDALFAAYPTVNTRAAAGGMLQRLPVPVRKAGLAALAGRPVEHVLGHVARVGRSALRASLLEGAAARHLPTQYLDEVALGRLRQQPGPAQAENLAEIRLRLAMASGLTDPARLAVDGNTLTGQSQSKVEGAVARCGLSVVSPFTHPRFRAAITALPADQQRPEGRLAAAEGKPVLQRAAEQAGLLPASVIYQPKQSPTEAPVDVWYSGPLRDTVTELFEDLPFDVNPAYLDHILRPKRAEELYRRKVAISRHTFQAIGLLSSYASFTRLGR